jgi:hypothetical protein
VPQAAEQQDDRKVGVRPGLAQPDSPERDVQVVAQQRGQRDVPAPPELRDGLADVGGVEVLGEDPAHHQAEPDGHVRVGAEIEVNLERVGNRSVPRVQRAHRLCVERGVRISTSASTPRFTLRDRMANG